MGITAVLWQEWVLFKRKFGQITSTALIGPMLYMIAFGWGLGKGVNIDGHSYMEFVIPGIIALTTMNTSFNAIAQILNINRLYDKTFEEFIISPLPMAYFALGKIIAGTLRGLYASAIIIIVSYLFGVKLHINIWFITLVVLNSMVFAALGFYAALIIQSHADMGRFSTFVMTPMTFLCGTFFSLGQIPVIVKGIIYVLPLTHASTALRSIALGQGFHWYNIAVLLVYFVALFGLGLRQCYRVEA